MIPTVEERLFQLEKLAVMAIDALDEKKVDRSHTEDWVIEEIRERVEEIENDPDAHLGAVRG